MSDRCVLESPPFVLGGDFRPVPSVFRSFNQKLAVMPEASFTAQNDSLQHGVAGNYDPRDLIRIFDALFGETENTRLIWGGDEPIYLPADSEVPFNRVIFAHGYFASALHEIAHWCIAGSERRRLTDFGYWYAPDGRSAAQQQAFEKVEVKPQALEWILSKACGKPFRVSVDNLNGEQSDPEPFKRAVCRQVQAYCREGIPACAQMLRDALATFYGTAPGLEECHFPPGELGLDDE